GVGAVWKGFSADEGRTTKTQGFSGFLKVDHEGSPGEGMGRSMEPDHKCDALWRERLAGLDGAALPMTLRSDNPDRAGSHKAHDTDSISDGSLFFTFPTRLSTGHMVI